AGGVGGGRGGWGGGGWAGGGPRPARGRPVPAHAVEDGVPAALSQPGWLLSRALVARRARRGRHGPAARPLLRRLLLGADAADVRRRNDERAHDGGALRIHSRRAPAAGRAVGVEDSGHGDDCIRRVSDRLAMTG